MRPLPAHSANTFFLLFIVILGQSLSDTNSLVCPHNLLLWLFPFLFLSSFLKLSISDEKDNRLNMVDFFVLSFSDQLSIVCHAGNGGRFSVCLLSFALAMAQIKFDSCWFFNLLNLFVLAFLAIPLVCVRCLFAVGRSHVQFFVSKFNF